MCTVEKLLISGIRSFSPHNDRALNFSTPLSLIVGHNGAGKTTVIECLKQATTGAMPPNAKNGQSFVHDPQVGDLTARALHCRRLDLDCISNLPRQSGRHHVLRRRVQLSSNTQ
jgi:recombinational DNA repair ATPase RecF